MEVAGSSEMFVTSYQNTWHHMLELQETAEEKEHPKEWVKSNHIIQLFFNVFHS
jgi:hypothetical protein